ncbi:MAG TPA: ATPase, T2SS/T4P/T4SS family [Roseateles sp.]
MSQLIIQITDTAGDTREITLDQREIRIGRDKACDIQLRGWRVGREHARLVETREGWTLEDLGQFTGTSVNAQRIVRYGPLSFADQIRIGGATLRVREVEGTPAAQKPLPATQPAPTAGVIHLHATAPAPRPAAPASHAAAAEAPVSAEVLAVQARHPWRKRVHDQLLEVIDLRRRDLTRMTDAELRAETEKLVREILERFDDLPAHIDREALRKEVLDEAVGLGPLEDLLDDVSVTEVMVNRADEIFVERSGRLERYPLAFTSDRAIMGVIERIVAPLGRRIDESSPLVDARLKDGSRVNAIIPPLALKGPTITIRKFSKKRLTADDLAAFGSVSAPMVTFLELCVKQRKNMIVSGGTGSGKTTLLNVLSNFIPDGERIITIEDAAELRLNHSHLVSLESRPSNVEGRGAITIRELVKNSLRMRPDRIVVGECRGGEALDMLQAMNTGHEGSLTTLHANTPRDALARLETLVLMAGMDLPIAAIRDQICSAVDIIVQQSRFACGSRKVTSITEVSGMENGKIQLQELFRYEARGFGADGKVQGDFFGCDAVPTFFDELREQGVQFDLSLFDRRAA